MSSRIGCSNYGAKTERSCLRTITGKTGNKPKSSRPAFRLTTHRNPPSWPISLPAPTPPLSPAKGARSALRSSKFITFGGDDRRTLRNKSRRAWSCMPPRLFYLTSNSELLGPQRDHRIHAGCPPGGHEAGKRGDQREQAGDDEIDGRIERLHFEEEVLHGGREENAEEQR